MKFGRAALEILGEGVSAAHASQISATSVRQISIFPGTGCAFTAYHESSLPSCTENSSTFSLERLIDCRKLKELKLSRWLSRLYSSLGRSCSSEQCACLQERSTASTVIPWDGSVGGWKVKTVQSEAGRMNLFNYTSH